MTWGMDLMSGLMGQWLDTVHIDGRMVGGIA